MDLSLIIEDDYKLGKSIAVCDENFNTVINLVARSIVENYTRYEVFGNKKKVMELLIKDAKKIKPRLDKIGQVNILYLNSDIDGVVTAIYFDNKGRIINSPIKSGELVCEQEGNYLFISREYENKDDKFVYANSDKVIRIKDFAVVGINGNIEFMENFVTNNRLEKINICNQSGNVLIFAQNYDNKSLIFNLNLDIINKKDMANEKI